MLDQVKSLISTHEKLLLLLQSKIVDIHNALGEIKIIIIIIRIIVNKIRTKFRTSEKTCISRYTYERSTSNYPPFLLHALIDLHFQSKTVIGIVRFSNFVAISILGEITNVQFPCRVISTKRGQKIGDITRRTKICGKSKRLESWPRSWTIAERNIVPLLDLLYSLSLHPSLSLSLFQSVRREEEVGCRKRGRLNRRPIQFAPPTSLLAKKSGFRWKITVGKDPCHLLATTSRNEKVETIVLVGKWSVNRSITLKRK